MKIAWGKNTLWVSYCNVTLFLHSFLCTILHAHWKLITGIHLAVSFCTVSVTLYWCYGGLCEANVVFCNVVRRLMLGDLYTRAHVALAVEEKGEGAWQALAGDRRQKRLRAHRRKETWRCTSALCVCFDHYLVPFNRMDPLTWLN